MRVECTDELLAHADDLRRIGLPLILEVEVDRYSQPNKCVFDAGFTRMAWMRESTTIENQNFSPGMDEDYYYWRDVVVWRVAGRAVLFEKRGVEARWSRVEFRAGGLFAIDADGGDVLLYAEP